MTEAERALQLVGDIYDAAVAPTLWSDVLTRVTDFVRGTNAILYSKNVILRGGEARYRSNPDPSASDEYFAKYAKLDPVTVGQYFFEVGDLYSITDVMPYEEFIETTVYKEWAKPRGWVDHLAATLDKSATCFAVFGVMRTESQGMVDDEMRQRMRLLVPHIRRAMMIGNVMNIQKDHAAVLSHAFDTLEAGVFLVDEHLHIMFTNAAGQELLGDSFIFNGIEATLTPTDAQARRSLRDAVRVASHGDSALSVSEMTVPLSKLPHDDWLAHVLPLTSGARRQAGHAYAAVAAIFVRKISPHAPLPLETMAQHYTLTPSEVRVLNALVNIGGIPKAAQAVGLSEATVKTHVQQLFAKTGVRRQADLIKLVAAHAGPFRA